MKFHLSINSNLIMKIFLFSVLFFSFTVNAQENKVFTGVLEYKISVRDTNLRDLIPDNSMFLYSNDTLTRMENFTERLGTQVVIRHIEKNKSYMLISSQKGNFAIKSDLNEIDTAKLTTKYTFDKKMCKTRILGLKANRMMVNHPEFDESIEFLYLKGYSNEYLNNFDGIPGLLLRYSVVTPDGILDYELIKFSEYIPNRDLFGIPSDFKKVTLEEFMSIMISPEEPNLPQN